MLYPQTQQNKFVNWQGDAEFRGEDFTATVTLGNPDVLVGSGRSSVTDGVQVTVTVVCSFKLVKSSYVVRQNQNCDLHLNICCHLAVVHLSGIVVAHYLQSITPALALGGELVYHRRPGEEGSVMSLVGRYTGETQFKD